MKTEPSKVTSIWPTVIKQTAALLFSILGIPALMVCYWYYFDGTNTKPPEGWTIQTDGERWRWKRPNGRESASDYPTKWKAINSAWRWENIDREIEHDRNRKWKDVK